MFKLHEYRSETVFLGVNTRAVLLALLISGCSTTPPVKQEPEKGLEAADNIAASGQTKETPPEPSKQGEVSAKEKDPYEGFNRTMYGFNNKVDTYLANPITIAYKWITPDFLERGISNFFNNAKTVNVVLNDVLQGKMQQSAADTGRFLVNTTIGVGGLFDVATRFGLKQNDEDFDQTLAVWGVPTGSYLVLPFLGPTTARGIPGTVVDTAANPITYLNYPVQILAALNARANAEGALKFIDEASLDPYVFTRESFLQWREYEATDGKAKPAAAADEFEEELEENLGETQSSASTKAATPEKNAAGGTNALPTAQPSAINKNVNNSGSRATSAINSAITTATNRAEPYPATAKQTSKNTQSSAEQQTKPPVPVNYNETSLYTGGSAAPW